MSLSFKAARKLPLLFGLLGLVACGSGSDENDGPEPDTAGDDTGGDTSTPDMASLQGVGTGPTGSGSIAWSLSADGRFVVGSTRGEEGTEGFIWSEAEGLSLLGDLEGGTHRSMAFGVSADGSVIVGEGQYGDDTNDHQAVRWESGSGGPQAIDFLPGGTKSTAQDVSADGAIVVGTSGSEERGNQGFRWTEAEGLQGLGGLIDGGSSYASAISSDGSTIVGAVTTATRGEAAYWTEDTGWMAIGTLEGAAIDVNPAASNVSSDGTTIAGNSSSTAARLAEAFVWTAETGMQGLGFLTENHTISTITGISGDGQTLIGVSGTLTGDQVSFIWDAEHGMRSIKEFFVEVHGLDLSGWTLGNALDISTDGHTLVGSGVHNGVSEGWVAHIPAN